MKLSTILKNLQIKIDRESILSLLLSLSLILLMAYPYLYPSKANAAVTEGFVRFNRLATGATISGTACLKSTLATQTNVVILMPAGSTVSQTVGDWTANTTGITTNMTDPVGGGAASAWPGIGNASSVSGLTVVFPGSALTGGVFYCFNFVGNALGGTSTLGSAGNDKYGQLKTQGGSPYTDSFDYATSIVESAYDQIVVTASVSATMTFSLTGTPPTIALGTLSTSSVTSGNVTQSVSTNARNGYISWVQGTNTTGGSGLRSSVASSTITTPGSFPTISDLASTTGVVLDAEPGTNTPTINAGFDGNGTTSGGNFEGGVFHEVSSKTGAQSGTTVVLNVRAKVAATQAAASDYTDTLVVVAAGSF